MRADGHSGVIAAVAVGAVLAVDGHLQAQDQPARTRTAAASADTGRKDRSTDRRVVEAVKAGDKAALTALLRQHADVNAPEADGTTALHWAVRENDRDTADQLIRAGADVNALNRYGVTAIYLAGVNGSAAVIERLLNAGVDANATGPEGETALMTAARTGSVDAVRILLEHAAAVDARESWHGQTALMCRPPHGPARIQPSCASCSRTAPTSTRARISKSGNAKRPRSPGKSGCRSAA